MTFDDDFIRFHFVSGSRDIRCKDINLDWPPPERIEQIKGVELPAPMVRVGYSQISDEDRAGLTHVVRGAEYRYEEQRPTQH